MLLIRTTLIHIGWWLGLVAARHGLSDSYCISSPRIGRDGKLREPDQLQLGSHMQWRVRFMHQTFPTHVYTWMT
jgi:hypothetical protein